MAVVTETPSRPVNVVLSQFADELLQSIQGNLVTQRIWPTEVYPGYAAINQRRAALGKWHSTGAGARSFEAAVHSSDGAESIALRFNDYMQYVDMGVGSGTRWDQVHAEQKAHYSRRYVAIWDRSRGESHRPAIMMEMRHLEQRMLRYFADFYGREVEISVLKSFDGLTPAALYF